MMLVIRIAMDNAAFEDNGYCQEASRILKDLTGKVGQLDWQTAVASPIALFDANGNRVGEAKFWE